MNMEKFGAKTYRDGLAASLGDLRAQEPEGRKKAQQFVALARETTLYQDAERIAHSRESEGKVNAHAEKHQTIKADRIDEELGQEKAVQQELPVKKEAIVSKEEQEARVAQELLTLASSNPGFIFGVSANGNLYGTGAGMGQFGYMLDQKVGKLEAIGNNAKLDPIIYEYPLASEEEYVSAVTEKKVNILEPNRVDILKPGSLKREIEGRVQSFAVYRCYINGNHPHDLSHNPFTSERRGVNSFNGALFVNHNINNSTLDKMSSQLVAILNNEDPQETARVMWKFFVEAFKKYTPAYWAFMQKQWEAQPKNQGKKIEDFFQ